jgi:hypothetical protein
MFPLFASLCSQVKFFFFLALTRAMYSWTILDSLSTLSLAKFTVEIADFFLLWEPTHIQLQSEIPFPSTSILWQTKTSVVTWSRSRSQ